MEIKTCEERVLMELENLEKENAEMKNSIIYANNLLGVLKQICTLEDDGAGHVMFRGGYMFDPKKDETILKLLGIFRKEEAAVPEDKKEAPVSKK